MISSCSSINLYLDFALLEPTYVLTVSTIVKVFLCLRDISKSEWNRICRRRRTCSTLFASDLLKGEFPPQYTRND